MDICFGLWLIIDWYYSRSEVHSIMTQKIFECLINVLSRCGMNGRMRMIVDVQLCVLSSCMSVHPHAWMCVCASLCMCLLLDASMSVCMPGTRCERVCVCDCNWMCASLRVCLCLSLPVCLYGLWVICCVSWLSHFYSWPESSRLPTHVYVHPYFCLSTPNYLAVSAI